MARPPLSEHVTATRAIDSGSATGLALHISVVSGRDAGAFVLLESGRPSPMLVGQSHVCDLRLGDPEVSRRHLSFEVVGHRARMLDLGSTNGTRVNGLDILGAWIVGGERVRLGATELYVESRPSSLAAAPVPAATAFGKMVGSSLAMRRLYPLCERVARSDVSVLIEGETGTGKEVLAEAMHETSARAERPFVVFDCTTISPGLIESELFGHERGAFTGALAARKGVFERADGGTLLLDEVGDLPLVLQPKLLRALQRGEVQRVGGDHWQKVDVRVIAATRRDIDQEVQAGRFRDDLFFRLAVARIELPPLRARHGDIAVLADHLWRGLGAGDTPLPYDFLQELEAYAWPGNVRELANAIARRFALGDLAGRAGSTKNAPRDPSAANPLEEILRLDLPYPRARDQALAVFDRLYVTRVLDANGGNVLRAAQASGIARRYFNIVLARTKE